MTSEGRCGRICEVKARRGFDINEAERLPYELVLIVMRVHLFPSRTQKLSSFTPTIVAGRLAVKIGNANTKKHRRKTCGVFLYMLMLRMPASVHWTLADGRTIHWPTWKTK